MTPLNGSAWLPEHSVRNYDNETVSRTDLFQGQRPKISVCLHALHGMPHGSSHSLTDPQTSLMAWAYQKVDIFRGPGCWYVDLERADLKPVTDVPQSPKIVRTVDLQDWRPHLPRRKGSKSCVPTVELSITLSHLDYHRTRRQITDRDGNQPGLHHWMQHSSDNTVTRYRLVHDPSQHGSCPSFEPPTAYECSGGASTWKDRNSKSMGIGILAGTLLLQLSGIRTGVGLQLPNYYLLKKTV
jgi:hypothetical protein